MDAGCVASQADITAEIARIAAQYPGGAGAGPAHGQPLLDYPPYRSTTLRHPK
ncbi:protocatechuate 3,4-dioxygenase subunit beta, partial [Mycobacterium tuberculosis]|nr:protocatechuate 3,4-dioxygenase subunit beta [Mycobacterium tuberculosis]